MNRRAILWSFPLLTAGLFWSASRCSPARHLTHGLGQRENPQQPGLWLVFAILLYLRYGIHVRGRQVALLTMWRSRCLICMLVSSAHPFLPGDAMNLLLSGAVTKRRRSSLREKLAFDGPKLAAALRSWKARYACEAVVLSTCNRVGDVPGEGGCRGPDGELVAEFLAEFHALASAQVRPCLYVHKGIEAVRHLFRVACSLDSLVVGEGQIGGQVKRAYEAAHAEGTAGPVLHILFQQAHGVAKRVRTQTGISRGHVSVSSVAVDYVRQVFDHFGDKTILVIGAGKMGELTLRHLKALERGGSL